MVRIRAPFPRRNESRGLEATGNVGPDSGLLKRNRTDSDDDSPSRKRRKTTDGENEVTTRSPVSATDDAERPADTPSRITTDNIKEETPTVDKDTQAETTQSSQSSAYSDIS